jgi:hypothetical protein
MRADVIIYIGAFFGPCWWLVLGVMLYAHWKLHVTRHECAPVDLKWVSDERRRRLP